MSAPTYRELLETNADYRRLWMGEVVSFLGDWFSTIAVFAMVQTLTSSAFAVTLVLVLRTLPVFLMVPIAGPLVDRLERRRLMVMTDIARAILVLGMLGAWYLQSVWAVMAILTLKMLFSGLFIPARSAVVPQLVTQEELPVAMALSGGTWSVSLAFGAALGGLSTHLVGIEGSLVIDAATFVLSAVLLAGLPELEPPEREQDDDTSFIEGVRYLFTDAYVAMLSGMKTVLGLASGGIAMLPLFGDGMFEATAGPLWIGLLYMWRGLGALVGSVGVRRITGDETRTMERGLAYGLTLSCAGLGIIAWSPSIGWTALGYFVGSVGGGMCWVYSGTLLQIATDARYRGRVFAMEFGFMTLLVSIVAAAAGAAADWAGFTVREVVLTSAALAFTVGMPWTLAIRVLGTRRVAPSGDSEIP